MSRIFLFFVALLIMVSCKKRNFGELSTQLSSTNSYTGSIDTRYVLSNLAPHIKATFIVPESLYGDKNSFVKMCQGLRRENFNLVFVDIQARGYYMARPGILLDDGNGNKVLMPGHPRLKVKNPILEMRSACGPQMAIVPWVEYSARAELTTDTRDVGYYRMGFTQADETYPVRLNGYIENVNGVATERYYPHDWYMLNNDGSFYEERDSSGRKSIFARWLDIRKPSVEGFLLSFADELAKMYGPVVLWDRVRYPISTKVGLEQEYKNPENAVTQFIRKLGKRLRAKGGGLYVSVAKRNVNRTLASRETEPQTPFLNEAFGSYWTSWAGAIDLLVPMTYFLNTEDFEGDLKDLDEVTQRLDMKFLPIVGMDKPWADQQNTEDQSIIKENIQTTQSLSSPLKVGYAYWYHCFKPSPDSSACD